MTKISDYDARIVIEYVCVFVGDVSGRFCASIEYLLGYKIKTPRNLFYAYLGIGIKIGGTLCAWFLSTPMYITLNI